MRRSFPVVAVASLQPRATAVFEGERSCQEKHRMAAVETNGNGASYDDASKPPEGVVVPPKDIRGLSCRRFCSPAQVSNEVGYIVIVEKTASYVARNGPAFEGKFVSSCQTFFPRLSD